MLGILSALIGLIILVWFMVTLKEIHKTAQRTEEALQEVLELLRNQVPPNH